MPLPSHSLFAITIWWFLELLRANLLAYLFIYLNACLLLRVLLLGSAFMETASWEGLYVTGDHFDCQTYYWTRHLGGGVGEGDRDGATDVKWPEILVFPLTAVPGFTVQIALLSREPFWVLVWIVKLLTDVSFEQPLDPNHHLSSCNSLAGGSGRLVNVIPLWQKSELRECCYPDIIKAYHI